MNLVTLHTIRDERKVIINADRIDGITIEREGYTTIYVGGSEQPFYVKESVDETTAICKHDMMAELNRKLKVVSESLSNIIEHENYDFGYSEAADIAEEVINNESSNRDSD